MHLSQMPDLSGCDTLRAPPLGPRAAQTHICPALCTCLLPLLRSPASPFFGLLEADSEFVSSSGAGEQCPTVCPQEEPSETKLTLRPPSLAAPYAPVQSWQHQPEKLIFESCGYEANVSHFCPPKMASLPPHPLPGPLQALRRVTRLDPGPTGQSLLC